MKRLDRKEYKEILDGLTRAVYPLLRIAEEEGATSPRPECPGQPEILAVHSKRPEKIIIIGEKDNEITIVIDLQRKIANKTYWKYKEVSHYISESSDEYRKGRESCKSWQYVPIATESCPIPKKIKAKIEKYHAHLKFEKKQEEEGEKYKAALKEWEEVDENWVAESINNWLIAAEIDLDFVAGKIYAPAQYEEYPQEINLYLLQEIVQQYS